MALTAKLQQALQVVVDNLNKQLPADHHLSVEDFPFAEGPGTGIQLAVPKKFQDTWDQGLSNWTTVVQDKIASLLTAGSLTYKFYAQLLECEGDDTKKPIAKKPNPKPDPQRATPTKADRSRNGRVTRSTSSVPPASKKVIKPRADRHASVLPSHTDGKYPSAKTGGESKVAKDKNVLSEEEKRSRRRAVSPILSQNHQSLDNKPATTSAASPAAAASSAKTGLPLVEENTATTDYPAANATPITPVLPGADNMKAPVIPGDTRGTKRPADGDLNEAPPKTPKLEVVIVKEKAKIKEEEEPDAGNIISAAANGGTVFLNDDDEEQAEIERAMKRSAAKAAMKKEVANLKQQVADRDRMLNERDSKIEERDWLLKERDSKIEEKDSKIEEMKATIASKNKYIEDQMEQIEVFEETLKRKNSKIERWQDFMDRTRALADEAPSDEEEEENLDEEGSYDIGGEEGGDVQGGAGGDAAREDGTGNGDCKPADDHDNEAVEQEAEGGEVVEVVATEDGEDGEDIEDEKEPESVEEDDKGPGSDV